jgi:hypothetical protein
MMTMKMRKKRAFMDQDLFVFAYAMPSSSDVVCETLVSMRKNSKPEKKNQGRHDATWTIQNTHHLSNQKNSTIAPENPIIRVSPPSS